MSVQTFVQHHRRANGDLGASRDDLIGLFVALGFTHGAEIGVWTGDYSKRLCERIPGLRLICVDPWQASASYHDPKNDQTRLDAAYRTACETLAAYACDIVRASSLDAAARVPDGSLDFVYLDANHGEAFVAADLKAWAPKVRPGGVFAGHDYITVARKPWLQVKPAVDAYVRDHAIDLYVLAAEKLPSFFWVAGHA